jgi:hypothetical protein
MRLARSLLVPCLVAAAVLSCAGMSDPLTAVNVQGCIKKNCDESEATAYKDCEASCRQRYGR